MFYVVELDPHFQSSIIALSFHHLEKRDVITGNQPKSVRMPTRTRGVDSPDLSYESVQVCVLSPST